MFYLFVFGQFSFEEVQGDFCFFFEAVGRQHVGVRDLAWGAFEAFYFDDTFVGQFCEDVIGFPQADARRLAISL